MQVHKGKNSPTESISIHALQQSRSKVQRRGGGVLIMWLAAIGLTHLTKSAPTPLSTTSVVPTDQKRTVHF